MEVRLAATIESCDRLWSMKKLKENRESFGYDSTYQRQSEIRRKVWGWRTLRFLCGIQGGCVCNVLRLYSQGVHPDICILQNWTGSISQSDGSFSSGLWNTCMMVWERVFIGVGNQL